MASAIMGLMNSKLEVDAFWALQEQKNPRAAIAKLIEQGHAEVDAEQAIATVVAEAKREIRKKGLIYLGIGIALALVSPIGILVTGYIEARTTALSVAGAGLAIYGLIQVIFAVGHSVETASS